MTRFITVLALGLLLLLSGIQAQTRRVQPHNHTTATAGLTISGGLFVTNSAAGDSGNDILVEDTVGNAVFRLKASSAGDAFLTVESTNNSWQINTSGNNVVLQDSTFAGQLGLTVAGDLTIIGGFIGGNSSSVASATATVLGNGNLFHITGTTTVTSVTTCDAANNGREVALIFDNILTFTDGSNLKIAGDFVTTADDSIKMVCDGTNWYEISRSVN